MAKTLYYGDNLNVLRDSVRDESIDLIYLDPPFNSSANYNQIFLEHKSGSVAQAQIMAFEDTWSWGDESARALSELLSYHGPLAQLLTLIVHQLGHNNLSAYLSMMAIRLVELRRVLKPTGSLYLHCDPTASHYLKLILDVLFGAQFFRNEITWKRSSAHNDVKQGRRAFGNVTDTLLYYTKSDVYTFNPTYTPYDENYTAKFYRHVDKEGRRYRLSDMTGPGGASKGNPSYEVMGVTRYWRYTQERMEELISRGLVVQTKPGNVPQQKRYLDEMPGVPLQNLWDDISPLSPQAKERLGYPTQKPVSLLERIIQVSSNPGDVVADPFCGCGTAVVAAQKLGRQWIGIDITYLAVKVMQRRLKDDFGMTPSLGDKFPSAKQYVVEGVPVTSEDARALFNDDPYQFQHWAVGLLDAQQQSKGVKTRVKKGGDTGVDGCFYFKTPGGETIESMIVSVKGGKNLNPSMVRDLGGTVTREGAAIGVLITMEKPTAGMRAEANKYGFFSYNGKSFPTLQILTVADLLAGHQPQLPYGHVNVSYEQKPVKTLESVGKDKSQKPLFLEQ